MAVIARACSSGETGACVYGAAHPSRFYSFRLHIMEDQQTIRLSALLDGISNDLDELRKKHPSDYNIKSITMWWELEKERVISRHSPGTLVKSMRRIQNAKRLIAYFFAGWVVMLTVNTTIRLLLR